MEEEIRKKAIEKYIKGQPPKTIYTEFKRSKKWFFKWLRRYQTGHKHWYKDQPRAPKKRPTKLSEVERQRIIETRNRLEDQKFAQIGVSAIKWELSKSGNIFPSDSTINRVLKGEGLIKKNSLYPKGR